VGILGPLVNLLGSLKKRVIRFDFLMKGVGSHKPFIYEGHLQHLNLNKQ
jgi:hypothetical protein